jgi:translation initiation factor 4G
MAVTIRQGRREDARFLAGVMLMASRGHLKLGVWDLIIGGGEERCLDYLARLALTEPVSLCHYSSFLVAECDRRPAAALCGFDPRQGGWPVVAENQDRVAEQLGWTALDFEKSAARTSPIWPCIPGQAEGAFIVENVATLPEFRRQGLTDALLAEVLKQGRKGHRLCQITMLIGNDPAQKAYEKHGFRFLDEKRSPEFEAALGSPGFRRLMLDW